MVNLRRRSKVAALICTSAFSASMCLTSATSFAADPGAAETSRGAAPNARIAVPVQHTSSSPVSLPAAAAVGQSASLVVGIDTIATAGADDSGPLSMTINLTRSIASVDSDDGSYTATTTIQSVDIAQAPAGYDLGELESIGGVAVQQSFTGTGTAVDTGAADPSADSRSAKRLIEWFGPTLFGFPAEPVAVGDSWTSRASAGANGDIAVGVGLQCRLAELNDDSYTVEISYAQSFSVADDAVGQVDGTISGQGTLTGSRHNPLALEGQLNQTINGIAVDDDGSTPWAVTMAISFRNADG